MIYAYYDSTAKLTAYFQGEPGLPESEITKYLDLYKQVHGGTYRQVETTIILKTSTFELEQDIKKVIDAKQALLDAQKETGIL